MTKLKTALLFLFKFIIVVSPVLMVSLYADLGMLHYSDGEVSYYVWNRDFCRKSHDQKYDVVIIGDSIGQTSYIPAELSETTVNLSLGGTTPAENYYVFKEWLENNEAPEDIFISFMDRHLMDSDCYYTRCLYFHRLSLLDNLEIMARARKCGEPSIGKKDCYKELIAYQFFWPGKYTAAMVNSHFNGRYAGNISVYDKVEEGRGKFVYNGVEIEEQEKMVLNDYYTQPLFDGYYRDLIKMCVDHGIRVHLVRPPMLDTIEFSEGYREEINGYFSSICEQYDNVSFDWFDEGYGSEYFADPAHMNERGAERFSRDLRARFSDVFEAE